MNQSNKNWPSILHLTPFSILSSRQTSLLIAALSKKMKANMISSSISILHPCTASLFQWFSIVSICTLQYPSVCLLWHCLRKTNDMDELCVIKRKQCMFGGKSTGLEFGKVCSHTPSHFAYIGAQGGVNKLYRLGRGRIVPWRERMKIKFLCRWECKHTKIRSFLLPFVSKKTFVSDFGPNFAVLKSFWLFYSTFLLTLRKESIRWSFSTRVRSP